MRILDHVIVVSAAGLQRIMKDYVLHPLCDRRDIVLASRKMSIEADQAHIHLATRSRMVAMPISE